jgi:mRNA interferase RelE/StbE
MQKREKVNLSDKYKIFETDEFIKRFSLLPISNENMIEKKLENHIYPQLKEEPHFGNNLKKLVNYTPPTWRYRIGKYRLFFIIDEKVKVIYIITIDHRKNAYR